MSWVDDGPSLLPGGSSWNLSGAGAIAADHEQLVAAAADWLLTDVADVWRPLEAAAKTIETGAVEIQVSGRSRSCSLLDTAVSGQAGSGDSRETNLGGGLLDR
jgi:hypothetical protein